MLPLDDRRVERFNSDLAGRPTLVHGDSQILFRGMRRLGENSVLNLENKSHSVTHCDNLAGLQMYKVSADSTVAPGTHQVRMEFAYDGGGLAKGGTVTLYVDGTKVGEGRVKCHRPDDLLRRRDLRHR